MFKLLKRLLKDKNTVGFSLVKNKVYLMTPAAVPRDYGEFEVIGKPKPFFRYPIGCSPNFRVGLNRFLTAQHCIGANRSSGEVKMSDGTYAKITFANPWRPITKFAYYRCYIRYILTGRTTNCINKDYALIDSGNEFTDIPIGVLSGGTEPPGKTFFAPYIENPERWIGREICGISYDYDTKTYVLGRWKIEDLGVVKYEIEGKIYPVYVWYAQNFSKPGFSGTNAFPAETCQQLPEFKTLEVTDYIITDKV